jgi:predicted PurR-regulated permease PerM
VSPLRRWMSQHGLPTWYSWVVLMVTVLSCLGLSVMVSLTAAQRSVESERRARLAAQQESERNQRAGWAAACQLIVAQDDAFSDPAAQPVTEAGRKSAAAWHELRKTFRCDQK